MNTQTTCDQCGEVNPADIHTCTPKRPPNCGTSFCSCIECVMEPAPLQDTFGMQVTKVWWDGDKLMAKPIPASEVYTTLPAAQPAPVQEPVAWTSRELELIDGMIRVQMDHAERCDHIGNRTMAEKQKGWDMERVALLQKIRATLPAAQPALKPLTDEWIRSMCKETWAFETVKQWVRIAEAAHGIKGAA